MTKKISWFNDNDDESGVNVIQACSMLVLDALEDVKMYQNTS